MNNRDEEISHVVLTKWISVEGQPKKIFEQLYPEALVLNLKEENKKLTFEVGRLKKEIEELKYRQMNSRP